MLRVLARAKTDLQRIREQNLKQLFRSDRNFSDRNGSDQSLDTQAAYIVSNLKSPPKPSSEALSPMTQALDLKGQYRNTLLPCQWHKPCFT
jgi:hypothetical protein